MAMSITYGSFKYPIQYTVYRYQIFGSCSIVRTSLTPPITLQGAPIKNNPLGKIHYLSYCKRFFHQIYSFYRGGFMPHMQQIL